MLRTIARNAFWNGLGTAGGIVLGLLTSVVIARSLGTADFGSYKLVIWLIGITVTFSSLGLPQALARFAAEYLGREDQTSANAILRSIVLVELGLSTLGVLVAGAGAWWLAGPEVRLPLLVGALVVAPAVMSGVLQSASYGAQHYRAANRASVVLSGMQLLLAIVVLRVLGWGVIGVVGVLMLRQLAYALFLARQVRRLYPNWSRRVPIVPAERKRLLVYVRDMTAILIVSAVVWESSEVFFLNRYHGARPEQIGFYALAWENASRAMSIPAMISGVLMPSVSAMYGRADRAAIGRVMVAGLRLIGLVALPIGWGGAAIAPVFTQVLFGADYRPAGTLMAWLLVFSVFGALAAVPAAVVYGTNEQGFIVRMGLAVAVLNILLDVLLIPRWAAFGAVIANSTSQLVASLGGIAYVAARQRIALPLGALVRTGLAAAGCAGLAYAVTQFVGGWPGLILAVLAAMISYVLLLGILRALEPDDLVAFERLLGMLPAGMRRPAGRVLAWLGRSRP